MLNDNEFKFKKKKRKQNIKKLPQKGAICCFMPHEIKSITTYERADKGHGKHGGNDLPFRNRAVILTIDEQ